MAKDDLDAFFNAAGSDNPLDIAAAAANLRDAPAETEAPPSDESAGDEPAPEAEKRKSGKRGKKAPAKANPADGDEPFAIDSGDLADLTGQDREDLDGKFIAVDSGDAGEPFVLIPAHVYSYVPWWGWIAIAVGLVMLAAGVIIVPMWSLDRLASRLGDSNEANAQYAMRSLVMNGDERTVRKLFDMASSNREGLTARLRAVDTMSLIDGVPEVDRALLRLELSGATNEQIREAAIAARKQREAARTRGRR
jgi:hypothetical protein